MTLTTVNPALLDTQAQYTGFKNRIINSAMVIDQRNAGASVTNGAGTTTYTLDRWALYGDQASKFTVQQSSTAATGFINSLLATSLSAYTVGASEIFNVQQRIEGLNVADLGWGTANAQTVTLSFWVRSSLTGTFGGSIMNSAENRNYPFSYTISVANTFEQKTITITGDTSGTWLTTNGIGIRAFFSIGTGATVSGTAGAWAAGAKYSATGAVSVVGTSGATFYITGVQLEKGSTATSFDYRPYGTELALCQRYFETSYPQGTAVGTSLSDSLSTKCLVVVSDSKSWANGVCFQVKKRTTPTIVFYNRSGTSGQWYFGTSGVSETSVATTTTGIYETGFSFYGSSSTAANNICYGQFTAASEL